MGKRVLILDDDKDVLDVMYEVLNNEGFEIKLIENGDDIFKEIKNYRPHVVLLDYILKGINGGEICHQIKTNPATRELPVLIVSAYQKVIDSLGYYGCDAFLAKPFNITDLVGQVNALVNQTNVN